MVGHFLPRLRFRPVYVSGTAKLRQALFTAMNDWHTAREFAVEAAKREIMRCDDVEKLRHLCFNLGGNWNNGSNSGSRCANSGYRCANWDYTPWTSDDVAHASIGSRFVARHLILA